MLKRILSMYYSNYLKIVWVSCTITDSDINLEMNILIEKSIFSWLLAIFKITLAREIFPNSRYTNLVSEQSCFCEPVFCLLQQKFHFCTIQTNLGRWWLHTTSNLEQMYIFSCGKVNCYFPEWTKLRYNQLFVWQQLVNADRLQVGIISSHCKCKCASLNRPKKLA